MNSAPWSKTPLSPGLYFVATPIGAARDITLRALDVLASADVIAAEDTRTLRRLMDIHGIGSGGRRMIACHDHSGAQVVARLVQDIAAGKSVAYGSEAGTPLVSDPGFGLARAVIAAGLPVTTVPGPSAMIAALTVAGLPTDRFLFAGFPPSARPARLRFLRELAPVPATLVFYESPRRIRATLADCAACFGGDRRAALCRELTKKFEQTLRGTLGDLAEAFADRDVKGEIVLLIEKGAGGSVADAESIEAALKDALKTMRVKDAAAHVAARLSLPRRRVYQAALAIEARGE